MHPSDHPAFDGLEPELRARVDTDSRMLDLPAGETVFRPGDPCRGLPLVLEGSIRVQMTGCSGHEIVLYRIGDADVCTLSIGCLMANRGYRAEAIVEMPTRATALPWPLFDELMAGSASFRRRIISAYGERLDTLMMLVEEVAFGRMDTRLAEWLNAHAQDTPLRVTHHYLAVELGTAREVVSRLLKEFERAGRIKLARGRIDMLAPIPIGGSGA